ncbi:hypothetical protein FF125_17130 [Aureibaculum algae]|uniref:Calx-beta domain-containing protein n=1 Tax=Aureibaculum algae TaxID=2584122 RepID=A0A5B7TXP1_9FLAO|nr:hypothetical protein [Aureibaculum algae]QCX40084.1 hypothetical protein FF125_17130 [Aureibaculum algae]
MKNIKFNSIFLGVLTMVSFMMSSCDPLLDDYETDFGKGPILAQFNSQNTTANFIQDGTTQTYDVAISIIGGDNQPINRPVEVTISADPSSTATAGTEFNLTTTSFTIPAGQLSTNAQIEVLTANLDPFDAKTLVLKIDTSSEGVSESNLTSIKLQGVCELDLSGFVGVYSSVNTRFAAPLVSTVELGPVPNSLLITNTDGYGDDEVVVLLSTDVTNPTMTYISEENQAYLYDNSTYGWVWATTLTPEQSTYNSCDYSLNLEYKRCVSIGCFGGSRVITMTKQ